MRTVMTITPAEYQRQLATYDWYCHSAGEAAVFLKHGSANPVPANLTGTLVASASGWLLLRVPNALGQGAFAALDEPGIELPLSGSSGQYKAHISVMRPEEIATIAGGLDAITERGKRFHFTLGAVKTVAPAGWDDVSRVWFIEVDSPELKQLRRTYGLSPLPNANKFAFHLTFAIRRKHVLGTNATAKGMPSAAKN